MISDSKQYNDTSTKKTPVYLNVYNFWSCFNQYCETFGIGVYHTGIQIYDDEYMFFGFDGEQTGVGYIEPYQAAYEFKEQILLGYTGLTFFEFDDKVLDPLRAEFKGNSYDLLGNNCNHFSRRLAKQMKLEEKFPEKIFRITDCCNMFRCCIPNCILNGRLDWFDSEKSISADQSGYVQLREQVKEQFDIKMLSKQKLQIQELKNPNSATKTLSSGRDANHTISSQDYSKKQSVHGMVVHTQPHHEVLKHSTLRKGIWPHTQNAHQRQSFDENWSPRNHTPKTVRHQEVNKQERRQSSHRYPNQEVKIYLSRKVEEVGFKE